MFEKSVEELTERGAQITTAEIAQQPELWRDTLNIYRENKEAIEAFLAEARAMGEGRLSVVFTGAGTSDYVGDTCAPYLRHVGNTDLYDFKPIATTDIVSAPRDFLRAEDPTLGVSQDEGSGDRIISGMGELHLDVVMERMRREYGISPRAGQPQVVARETVRAEAEGHGLFDRELGAVHHVGEVTLTMAPAGRDKGNTIALADSLAHPADPKEAVPRALMDEVLQGISDSLLSGPQTGYPVQDVIITVTAVRREGATAAGCRMAAATAVRDAMEKARPTVLEPIMSVEIVTPEEALGASISLFQNCGGKVEELGERGGMRHLSGMAPMRKLFGFSTDLRSATHGRAGLMMRFERFDVI